MACDPFPISMGEVPVAWNFINRMTNRSCYKSFVSKRIPIATKSTPSPLDHVEPHLTVFPAATGDDEEHYEDEEDGSGDEWGEGDEETPAAKPPSGKTEEEKLAEANEIGYKVVGPLGADEKPFKPYEPVFAVVQIGSHQFKVSNGDSIFTERLKFCDVNDKLVLNRVLMLGSQAQTIIGRPILTDATVHAVVEEHVTRPQPDGRTGTPRGVASLLGAATVREHGTVDLTATSFKAFFLAEGPGRRGHHELAVHLRQGHAREKGRGLGWVGKALDAKVIIFKKKRRKNYRRTRGHRQELTKLRITNIEGIDKSFIQQEGTDKPESAAVAA
ncbi:50S ribosomal protein L21, mitochondrial [Triticum urartu]|uniref:Large ribosomal subunit protein bL21m n=1 Tax=Triticum urartu TaxID=4572 RepID=M7ZIW5_TRIUA|nr:50S ribosomal protein L21, mitochondrial [Triticum urartu]